MQTQNTQDEIHNTLNILYKIKAKRYVQKCPMSLFFNSTRCYQIKLVTTHCCNFIDIVRKTKSSIHEIVAFLENGTELSLILSNNLLMLKLRPHHHLAMGQHSGWQKHGTTQRSGRERNQQYVDYMERKSCFAA